MLGYSFDAVLPTLFEKNSAYFLLFLGHDGSTYAVHSISTSVSNGSCFTATQVRHCGVRQSFSQPGHAVLSTLEVTGARGDTHGLRIRHEKLIVCLVHGGEVVHGRDEDVDLDHVVQAAPRLLEHGLQVLEGLSLDGRYVLSGQLVNLLQTEDERPRI